MTTTEDLKNLSQSFYYAVRGNFMSLEQARELWKLILKVEFGTVLKGGEKDARKNS